MLPIFSKVDSFHLFYFSIPEKRALGDDLVGAVKTPFSKAAGVGAGVKGKPGTSSQFYTGGQ